MGKTVRDRPMEMLHWAQVNQAINRVRRTRFLFQRVIPKLRAGGIDMETSEDVLTTLKESQQVLERIRAGLMNELSW